jgi:hypothetical protein
MSIRMQNTHNFLFLVRSTDWLGVSSGSMVIFSGAYDMVGGAGVELDSGYCKSKVTRLSVVS